MATKFRNELKYCEAIVGGDASHAEISAASILAKVNVTVKCMNWDQNIRITVLQT